jgi:hypothetical protein
MVENLDQCHGCQSWGIVGDEVYIYDLDEPGFNQVPLCLDCGPEENYENLV